MLTLDLRSVAKRIRRSALLRGVRRDVPAVGQAAREILRALLPGPTAPARPIVVDTWQTYGSNSGGTEAASGLAAHLGQVVHRRLGQLIENMDFTAHEDQVEALHDLRVASRRLRAFVDVFHPLLDPPIVLHVKKPLKRVTRAAGTLRDLDVQIALVEERVAVQTTDATRAALEYVLERIQLRREEEQSRVVKKLRKVRLDDVSVGMCAALGETVARLPASSGDSGRLAWTLLEPLVSDAEAHDPAGDGESSPEVLHEYRICMKRLRYALELVAPLLGDDQKELVKTAEGLQELLGTHHDLAVILALVEEERGHLEGRGRRTLPFGLTVLRGELETEERELFSKFGEIRTERGYFREHVQAALFRA